MGTAILARAPLWRVELLGRLRAIRGDQVITRFRRQKAGALLAYLAFYPERIHSRDELIEMLWPECDPAAGRDRLSTLLVSLRRQLEPPGVSPQTVLVADRAAVRLSPDAVATDVASFEACMEEAARAANDLERSRCLSEAVERYPGELLPGLCEEWVLRERSRLAELHLHALGLLVRRWEQDGNLLRAIDYARRAVAADPLREEAHQELIRLLMATGQPESARRALQELERLLDRELGEAPCSTTLSLLASVPSTPPPAPGRPTAMPHGGDPTGGATVTFLVAASHPTDAWDLWRRELTAHRGHLVREADGILVAAFPCAGDALSSALGAWRLALGLGEVSSSPGGEPSSSPSAKPGGQSVGRADRSASAPPRPAPGTRHPVQRATAVGGGMPGIRIALHTGDAELHGGHDRGATLDRAIAILRAAHPGQILVSETAAALLRSAAAPATAGISLIDLGLYRLGDGATGVQSPERLFQASLPETAQIEFPPPLAEPFRRPRLPAPLTRFFGREGEIADLCRRLRDPENRLITLTGPGGSGKTRLALAVAEEMAGPLRGAVWIVPLADLTEAHQIVDALVNALELPRRGGRDPLAQVVAALEQQPALMVLDNLEQMRDEAAPLVRSLLERAPSLTCLATSRKRLGLTAEREFVVHPLPTPLLPESLDELAGYACVQLFVDRAQAVRPDFQVTKNNAAAVAELCRRLDGLPLALELAAARAALLTPAQLLVQLAQPLEVLVDRRRDAVPRHRSLRAAMEWSHRLLPPDLQQFFARLSVFRGAWTLEAAQAVCGGESALAALEQLRECSLVSATETGPEMRFRILEPLREFAAEQLPPEERELAAERHAAYYLSLAEAAEPHLVQGDQSDWLELLEREHDNMRAVLAWSVEAPAGDARAATRARLETGLRLATALARFWGGHGYLAEGRDQLARLLRVVERHLTESPGDPDTDLDLYRARALVANTVLLRHSDYEQSRRLCEESLAVARSHDDRSLMGTCYLRLGMIARDQGDFHASRRLLEEAQTLLRETGQRQKVAWTHCILGDLDREEGNLERAGTSYLAATDLLRELGNRRDGAWLCTRRGRLAQKQGDLTSARRWFEEALGMFRDGRDPLGVAATLGLLGELALHQGEHDRAWDLGQQALRLHRELENEHDCGAMLELLGRAALARESCDAARGQCEEMLVLAKTRKNPAALARAHALLGMVALRTGDRDTARTRFHECLSSATGLQPNRGLAESLEGLAALAGHEGSMQRAARLFAIADAVRAALRTPRAPYEEALHRPAIEAVRANLGEAAWDAARAESRQLPLTTALEYALTREEPFLTR